MLDPGKRIEAYKSQQADLVAKYRGKIIAMVDGIFQGAYETKIEAVEDMQKRFPGGQYFIVRCEPGDAEYTRRFRSRVFFPQVAAI